MVRTLEEVCEDTGGGFCAEILGNHYCMLAPTEDRIECFYRGEKPDENGMFNCHNPEYGNPDRKIDDINSVYVEHPKEGNA